MKTFIKNNINGILGTIIFHLLIVVGFMASKLSVDSRDDISAIMIDFEAKEIEPDKIKIPLVERRLDYDQYLEYILRRNIAVNEAEDRPVPDQFKNLDPSAQQELDTRVSEVLQQAETGKMSLFPQIPEITMETAKPQEAAKPEKKEEPYTGPTNIYYNLQGRKALWLPVPIYKCPDKGIVMVDILVNQLGYVIHARVNISPKDFNEECLFEAATNAALKARFNQSQNSPQRQAGTITFHFQPQERK